MPRRPAVIAVLLLALPLYPVAAVPDAVDGALVDLRVEHDGKVVFSPQMLVRLGQPAEASIESHAGEGHRVLLLVTREDDVFHMRSTYLTRQGDKPWAVVAEPRISVREATAGSMDLIRGDRELRFNVEIVGGTLRRNQTD